MNSLAAEWIRWDGGEFPIDDDDTMIDVRFDGGKVLEKLYPWDVKLNGNNPGFGWVEAYRLSDVRKRN